MILVISTQTQTNVLNNNQLLNYRENLFGKAMSLRLKQGFSVTM
ncbi:hypothetical protein HMPREF9086_2643 [Enterobacter hormaechei ATCC 49162]|nr:hypothetical protein HMPREF9086_2643 [Enterobacter hormaechei ATCC 49162]